MNVRAGTIDVGAGLALVPRHPGDAVEMFALVDRHRAELREWITWSDAMRTVADMRRFAQFSQTQFEEAAGFDYSVRIDGTIAGGIGLYHLDWASHNAQIGYWLAPNFRGRGTMTAAVRGLNVARL